MFYCKKYILLLSLSFIFTQTCCEVEEIAINDCGGMTGCYIPQCDENCNWESMQCWSSTGYCWCVDENGIEIDGTSTPSWQGFPDCSTQVGCEEGYVLINDICFYEGDINVLQKFIDNSYSSDIDLGCDDYPSTFCGSPNPYMDDIDSWFWVSIDSVYYEWTGNANGVVEPLELGIQEWENGRLTSLMCGAYIYCSLSGPIPEEIEQLTEIRTLRLEYNYLSGFIPDSICDLGTNHSDYLVFDLVGNFLCPPYPECIDTSGFWSQDTSSCSEIGDITFDGLINIQDIVLLVYYIMNFEFYDYQDFIISDINFDGVVNVLDVVVLLEIILNS